MTGRGIQEKFISVLSRVRKGRFGFLVPGIFFNRRVQITRSGIVFLLLILLVGFASINTGNNLLYLILGVMISLLMISFSLSEAAIDMLLIERSLPERVQADADFQVTYRISNQKRILPSIGIMIEDNFGGKPCRVFLQGVRAGKTEAQRATTSLQRRGRMKLGLLILSTRHPFGFFFKSKQVNLQGELVVCPRVDNISPEITHPPYISGEMRAARKGEGDELFGFRDYIRGDSLRLIHWKTSARAGRLLARELEEEKKRAVVVELDISSPRPEQDDPGREEFISRAASLCKYFLDFDYQVRMDVSGRGVDFGEGPAQLARILYFLAVFDDIEKPWPGERLEPVQSVSRVAAGTP